MALIQNNGHELRMVVVQGELRRAWLGSPKEETLKNGLTKKWVNGVPIWGRICYRDIALVVGGKTFIVRNREVLEMRVRILANGGG